MKRISKISTCLVACTLMLVLFSLDALACQVDEFYLTKEGYLAATTNETLAEAVKYAKAGRQDRLSALEKSGLVVKLREDDKVRVLERSIEWQTLEIRFMNGKGPYWVKDGSLKPVEPH
jgi:hypothetical protein